MKKDFSALSFSEKERICESIFFNNGPYWHIYTNGTKMQNIFCCEGNPAYTPDSYPWGGGCAFFNPWLKYLRSKPLRELPILTQRELLHTRDISPFANIREIDLIPFIPSFCDIKLGESIFRDAR